MIKKTGRRIAVRVVFMYCTFLLLFSSIAIFILWKTVQLQNERSLYELLDQEIMSMNQEAKNRAQMIEHEQDEEDHQNVPKFSGREFGRSGLWFRLLRDERGKWALPFERVNNLSVQVEKQLNGFKPQKRQTMKLSVSINVENSMKSLSFLVAAEHTSQGWLYVGNELSASDKLWWTTIWWLLGVIGIFAVIGSLLAWLVTGRSLRPVADAMKRQAQFVTNASHEFRTPLSIIRTSLDCLGVEEEVSRSSIAQYWMKNVYDEVDRMSGIIDRLLSMARMESGAKPIVERMDAAQRVAQVIQRMKLQADSRQLTIEQFGEGSFLWDGDPVLFEQLLSIFLENAIKYAPDRGTISVTLLRKPLLRNRSILRMEIMNDGDGVAKEHLPYLFERFYVADESRTNRKGLGIGLSIAQAIVQAHDGLIGVSSEQGKGAMFWVELPVLTRQSK